MENNFDKAFTALLGNEGGYSNNPADKGGETNWGVTIAVARANGYSGPMKTMQVEVAKDIYRRQYWRPEFDQMPYSVAFQVFDGAVNSGVAQAIKWLQQALGTKADGIIGPATMAAVKDIDPLVTIIRFNAARLAFFTSLSTWPTFGRGWANRIASNLYKAVA